MPTKSLENKPIPRRSPRQARSLMKVELMLEAAMRLLDEGELESLTTNAVAARAGVSIGTLYQYFPDKHALLDALVQRELGTLADEVTAAMQELPATGGERVRRIVRAVVGAYGGRGRVHRLLMGHALSRTQGGRLSPLFASLMRLWTTQGLAAPGQRAKALTPAQAFVLVHATAGVLRTLVASAETPPVKAVEEALVQLVLGYLERVRG